MFDPGLRALRFSALSSSRLSFVPDGCASLLTACEILCIVESLVEGLGLRFWIMLERSRKHGYTHGHSPCHKAQYSLASGPYLPPQNRAIPGVRLGRRGVAVVRRERQPFGVGEAEDLRGNEVILWQASERRIRDAAHWARDAYDEPSLRCRRLLGCLGREEEGTVELGRDLIRVRASW